ncbi:MAG: FkbM family methyltransferase [Prolixibacteraceae bacterium]
MYRNIRLIESLKNIVKSGKKKNLIKKRRAFYLQFLKPGDLYFDVGANYGNRIEPLMGEGITIIAVEPQVPCVKYLRRKFKNNITVIPCGLAEKKGIRKLYISNASPLSSFSIEWINATRQSGRFGKYKWHKEQPTEMETLDNLIKKYGKPQFIKIDVEGYEYEVLKGLSQPVSMLSFEYTIPERKQSIVDCIERVTRLANNKKVLFNYSAGETMEWAMDEWVNPDQMKEEIELDRFVQSEFGDIYANMNVKDET